MKILIPTMVWGRWDVFDVFAAQIRALQRYHDVQVMAVGSEGDVSRSQVEKHGFEYREFPNDDLGRKAQYRLECTKDLEWDYLLFLGSDDLVSLKTMDYLSERMSEGYDFIASTDLFIYVVKGHPKHGLYHSRGYQGTYRDGEPMAVGRCMSRELIERMEYEIWSPIKKHIDKPAWERIRSFIQNPHIYRLRDGGKMIVDIKSSESVSQPKSLPRYERLGGTYINKMESFKEMEKLSWT